jgi:CRP-like cAMP-binding protein
LPRKDKEPLSSQGRRAETLSIEALKDNAILRHAKDAQVAIILKHGDLFEMPTRHLVYRADEPIREVYFPTDSVLSVVTQMENGESIEVGTIGREGTSAIPMLMGGTLTANDCYCQVPGHAIRLPVEQFHQLLTSDPVFRSLLDRYLQAYVNFLGQLTACSRLHTVEERCARWLLLTRDRVGRDTIKLTHEYLAMMLGSRRSGVSLALGTLRRAGCVEYLQGSIEIVDVGGLFATTCECYNVAQRQFSALLPDTAEHNAFP